MRSNVHIGTRLREERERLCLGQMEVAERAGVGRKSQFNYESGERQPDASYLAAVAGLGIDITYVVTGQRSPALVHPPSEGSSPPRPAADVSAWRDAGDAGPLVLDVQVEPGRQMRYQVIPKYKDTATAGPVPAGVLPARTSGLDVGGEMAFSPDWIERQLGPNRGALASITVSGDSMAPTILDGETVIIDTTQAEISVSGIYVIAPRGRKQLKRIHLRLDGSLEVISDNGAYRAELVPADREADLHVVGRMVWPRVR